MRDIAVTVKLSTLEEVDMLGEILLKFNPKISLFEIHFENLDAVNAISISDILDPFEEQGLQIASIRIPYTNDFTILEKLAIIGSETWGRNIILEKNVPKKQILPKLFDLFSVYKTRILLSPIPPYIEKTYQRIREYIGGVFGLAINFTYFRGIENPTSFIKRYLGVVKSISITNYDESRKPLPILDPRGSNNPKLLRC